MPLTRRTALIALAAVITTVGLAGCGTTSDPASSSPTTEWVGPTNPVVPEAPANGEVLTTDDQLEGARIAGFAVYEMADGTKVAIDPAQDLPQQVADEGIAQAQANAAEKMDLNTALGRAGAFVSKTGKNLIFIFPVYASFDGETVEMIYTVAGGYQVYGDAYASTTDPNVLVASLQAWASAQPNPETYQIIVVPMP